MPCAETEINIENNTVSNFIETNSSSDNHYEDPCSPFCICNCCSYNGFYKFNDYGNAKASVKTFIEKHTTEYHSTLFSNFQNSIWQPPQIS